MDRKKKALIIAVALAVVAGLFGYKFYAELARGEHIFWLAELWPPAAVLSIGVVTCLEFLVGPSAATPAPSHETPISPSPKAKSAAAKGRRRA
jgi:hypothetical protein